MRPINRGSSPRPQDFDDYRDAFPELQARLGPFCSYCERRIATQLAIEHIQPKGLTQYAGLIGRWDNFLLGCVNCNSSKRDKDVRLDTVFLPDRDNTSAAFDYTPDGNVTSASTLPAPQRQIAASTLALTGLDKHPNQVHDGNGRLVAVDRVSQRMEVWLIAEETRKVLQNTPTDAVRQLIVKAAKGHGFFSIWMKVFVQDQIMRRMLIQGFPGTAADCFDAQTRPVSPRPPNGLPDGGKI